MKPSLGLHTTQSLNLTPQLQQALRLLVLSGLELELEVQQMLLDNPMLERTAETSDEDSPSERTAQADPPDTDAASPEAEVPDDWDGDNDYSHETLSEEWVETPVSTATSGGADADFDAAAARAAHESLHDSLTTQARALGLQSTALEAVLFVIGNLNDDGYLEESPVALAQAAASAAAGEDDAMHAADDFSRLEAALQHITDALQQVQQLDPPGVGARDTAECLTLQLHRLYKTTELDDAVYEAAVLLCKNCMDGMARADLERMRKTCAADETTVTAAFALVKTLDPRPGRQFTQVDSNIIVPDVLVREVRHSHEGTDSLSQAATTFEVELNSDTIPRLRINQLYAKTLKDERMLTTTALGGKLQEARWFLRSIQQRYDTLLRVSQVIVQRQEDFFRRGAIGMKPLILREVADLLGMHESTISRVTTGKYLTSAQGTFELKYFFSSSVGTAIGGSASSIAVSAMIAELIRSEDKTTPLSDQTISDLLKQRGVRCARRTVAKYREAMRIAVASLRRELPAHPPEHPPA